MAKRIQFRGGTTAQHNVFTGAIREITVDTDKDTLVVHDGSTVGGFPLARESAVSTHTARTDNPHSVTKTQVGLSNVDNTADANKVVLSASKLTTARTITIAGDASGSASFDGSANATITIAVADDSHTHAFANITSKPTTLTGYGITDADTSAQVTTKINNAVAGLVASAPAALDTLNEFALALGNDENFAATTASAIGSKIPKVSTPLLNAVPRVNADGTLQNSGVIVDDNNSVTLYSTSYSQLSLNVDGDLKGWLYADANTSGTALASYDYITFNTNNTEKMRIDSTGNVGIGAVPNNTATNYKFLNIGNSSDGLYGSVGLGFEILNNAKIVGTQYRYSSTGKPSTRIDIGDSTAGAFKWYTAPSGMVGNPITWTQAMTLNASSTLIIGSNASTGNKNISIVPSNFEIQATEFNVAHRALKLNPTGGNLLIGTTTDNGIDKLQVNGSMSSGSARFVSDLNGIFNASGFLTGDFAFSIADNGPCDYGTLHQISRGTTECTQMVQDVLSDSLFVRRYVNSAWTPWTAK